MGRARGHAGTEVGASKQTVEGRMTERAMEHWAVDNSDIEVEKMMRQRSFEAT